MQNTSLDEFERIARFFRPLAKTPWALGLSDDAALLSVPSDHQLVITTDVLIADIHFFAYDLPEDISAKLLRVNLSDLAAMGAEPFGYTLTTALPDDLPLRWVEAFAHGLGCDQEAYGISLLGGDSVVTHGPITLSVTAFGTVPHGTALTRHTAIHTDHIFVTGTIGDAGLGLTIALGHFDDAEDLGYRYFLDRLRRPQPRLSIGISLRGIASAAIDISDGLVADLAHLCRASGCAARIDATRVPLSAPARTIVKAQPDQLAHLLTSGDDYELLFTASPSQEHYIAEQAQRLGVPITKIGTLVEGTPGSVTVLDQNNDPLSFVRQGWTHFLFYGVWIGQSLVLGLV